MKKLTNRQRIYLRMIALAGSTQDTNRTVELLTSRGYLQYDCGRYWVTHEGMAIACQLAS